MNQAFQETTQQNGVVCVGRLYCDLVFTGLSGLPELGKEIFADGVSLSAGGGAYITAAYLAALSRPAFICATLPQDPFGAAIMPELQSGNVDLSGLNMPTMDVEDGAFDPQLTVAIATQDDRAFITRKTGVAVPGSIEKSLDQSGVTHLHIGELATLIDRPDLITLARKRGLSVSLDCSWSEQAIHNDNALSLIDKTDVFLPNAMEACALFGLAETDLQGAASKLAQLSCLSVIKCGVRGAGVATHEGLELIPAIPTRVIDTTGAGDAFNAGFLNSWLNHAAKPGCLAEGVRCGSFAVANYGGANRLPALAGMG